MQIENSGLVEIVRDFLVAHELMQRTFERFRAGTLRFVEVQDLVGDDEHSALFRLKEHCHALFRSENGQSPLSMRREALFDLAVGSLFHEAMKFRENFYQLEVYAPRVRKLQSEAGDEARELFLEFEKILVASKERLGESLSETEALLEQTSLQLRVLLADQRKNGLIARYLFEKRDLVDKVFRDGLDSLLAEVHGSAGRGYAAAARSYLDSAHFVPALSALGEARDRLPDDPTLPRLESYAHGMQAFLGGDYAPSLRHLHAWLEAEPNADVLRYVGLAQAAIAHIDSVLPARDRRAEVDPAVLKARVDAIAKQKKQKS